MKKPIILLFGSLFLLSCLKREISNNKFLKVSEFGRYLETKKENPFCILAILHGNFFIS